MSATTPIFVGNFTKDEATAAQRTFSIVAVDATDGLTLEPGLTYAGADNTISKNGGAFGNLAGTVTEIASTGVYKVELAAGDVDTLGTAIVKFVDAAARTIWVTFQVIALDLNVATVNPGAGGITTASFAAGAIDAAAIAADAIGSSELAATAVAEIADAIWDEATSGHVAAGSFGLMVAVLKGLSQGNVVIDGGAGVVSGPTYDAAGMLTVGRIRVFASGADALAASAGAAADADSEIAAFTIGASGSNGRMTLYRVSED
jgi:hypothetical protein